jgi:hypothetical protein
MVLATGRCRTHPTPSSPPFDSMSISTYGLGEAPGSFFFIRAAKNGSVMTLVPRFPPDLGLHPSGESRPSPIPRGALGDFGREKSGKGPVLSAREHANPTIWSQKSLSPFPRCSVAAGTTPRQSADRLPELRRPSSHQPIFRRLAIFRSRATPSVVPRRHARQVFVHLPDRTWTQTTRTSRCLPRFLKKRW